LINSRKEKENERKEKKEILQNVFVEDFLARGDLLPKKK